VPSLAAFPAGVSLMEFSEAPLSSMLLSVGLEGRGLWGSLGNAVRLAATVSGDGESRFVSRIGAGDTAFIKHCHNTRSRTVASWIRCGVF
jgi:hypothetical protein